MSTEIHVPALGESITEATVGEWLKTAGEEVEVDEILCELETDKVAIEVPAPAAGTISEIVAAAGETVAVGALLAVLSEGAGGARPTGRAPARTPSRTSAEPAPAPPPESAAKADAIRQPEDAPSARKLMEEKAVDRTAVTPTGRDDRVMKEDVQKFLADTASAAPAVLSVSDPGADVERVAMTRLRRTIAQRLKDAQNTAAILTTFNEVDMSSIMAWRRRYKDDFARKHGVKLGFMSFFIKACCMALHDVPEVNAEIDGNDIVYRRSVNMGVAVGTPTGLVVPVLRHAESLRFDQIEREVARLGGLAREGKLAIPDMQGGSFTITNGGVYGSLMSTPIINPPQSGILGMHKIQERPVAIDGEVVVRPMMYIALSYDHRIVDGQGAVTFLVKVKEAIEDPARLMLDI